MRDSISCLVAVAMGAVLLLAGAGCGSAGKARSTDAAVAGDVPWGGGGASGADGALAGETGLGGALGSGGSVSAGGFPDAGGTTGAGGRGEDGGFDQDGAMDANMLADGVVATADGPSCGDTVCAAGQICVRPTCVGGTAPPCLPRLDGGACPTGLIYASTCIPGLPERGGGCTSPPCVDPPPFCLDPPATCGGKPTCACLPFNVCNSDGGVSGGMCTMLGTSIVRCMAP